MDEQYERSIFSRYYANEPFEDRYTKHPQLAVDVLIPIVHTNELWRANLLSIYREIPVHRLLIGDGGCIDGSLAMAREYPRVEVLDHRGFKSLGYSIRRLIEAVQTDWFVYLHSDVYLPRGWFDAMTAHCEEFDWFECNQRISVMADYLFDVTQTQRAYSGSQMGRRAAFRDVLPKIDDDYLYRNEDIIISELVRKAGFRYGKVGEAFHFHQVMYKPGPWRREIRRVNVELDVARDEDVRANYTYLMGIAKYTDPDDASPDIVVSVKSAIDQLVTLRAMTRKALMRELRELSLGWHAKITSYNSRDRLADRITYMASIYRNHGAYEVMRTGVIMLKHALGRPLVSLPAAVRGAAIHAESVSDRADGFLDTVRLRVRAACAKFLVAFAEGYREKGVMRGIRAALAGGSPSSAQAPSPRDEMARKLIAVAEFVRANGIRMTLQLVLRKLF